MKLLILSNFTFFHNVFYAICIFNSHISVICCFFVYGMVSNWCIREWVETELENKYLALSKLKIFADDNINVSYFFDRAENISGKGENAA